MWLGMAKVEPTGGSSLALHPLLSYCWGMQANGWLCGVGNVGLASNVEAK